MSPVLRLENLWKCYVRGGHSVVRGVTFDLREGEILSLLGPSGCGKTTVLRLIAGFERLDRGRVVLQDRVLADANIFVKPERRDIGIVFQDYALFPHLNVIENVAFGLTGMGRSERRKRAMDVLALVGLADYAKRRPHALSGGQQQRVALARSLAPAPKVILLDEPFSNLDASLRAETRTEVRRILKQAGMSAILVTHDQEEALTTSDRIAVMNEGRIEQIGDPISIYRRPESRFVAQFLGSTNLLQAEAHGALAHTPFGELPLAHDATGEVVLSIRPEHIQISGPATGAVEGVVLSREFKGHDQYYRVTCAEQVLSVLTDHKTDYEEGARVSLTFTESAIVLGNARED